MKDSAKTFDALVEWFRQLLLQQKAPGFLVGLSGTDSLITFLAAAKACQKVGKSRRALGVHFRPSEEFLEDHPEAESHLWFRDQVIPWLIQQCPQAEILIDTSIDWRCDGQRWGALMDLSVIANDRKRSMCLPENQYWVVGTRNRTEDALFSYSNASMAVSLQPIIHLWKSEILQLSEHLGVPQIALNKSCQTDCICGRLALPARHIKEVDLLLMARSGELTGEDADSQIEPKLRLQLIKFIETQIAQHYFKKQIPYTPNRLIFEFESGSLDIKKFNHFGHLDIAFRYLRKYDLETALERYLKYLKPLLEVAGQSHRFNPKLTRAYFDKLNSLMWEYPAYRDFGELAQAIPSAIDKIKA